MTALIINYSLGMGFKKFSVFYNSKKPSPTAIPYLKTPEACKKRDDSVWNEGTCWDLTHPTDW